MNIIAQFLGEHHSSRFGMSLASLDLNHDGYIDLIVGSPSYGYVYNTSPSRGKVYIYFGGPTFNSITQAAVTLEGTYNGTTGIRLNDVINVGDVSGDGYDDLYIYATDYGAPSSQVQRLMFFYGGTSNLNTPDHIIYFAQNTNIVYLCKLGDVNGDSFDDIGVTYYTTGQFRVFSIYLGGSFTENVIMTYSYYLSTGICAVCGIGDINNDGYDDFTIAYTNNDPNTGYHLINIYYGNSTGVYTNPQTLIQTQQPITKISRPLGDMNNDGYDDFMGYLSNAGTHVWLGADNLNTAIPSFNLVPGWTGDETSRTLVHGDFNHDGYEDGVGASYNLREVDVYLGRAIPNGTSDLMMHQYLYDNFGLSLTTGDYNADGFCDIAISAPNENNPWPTGDFYGFVFVYGGNVQLADTTVGNEDETLPAPDPAVMSLIAYPNPLPTRTALLKIELTGSGYKTADNPMLEIYNIKGQRLCFQPIQANKSTTLDTSSLNSGIYVIKVRLGNTSLSKKFVIK